MAVISINYNGGGSTYDDEGNILTTDPVFYESVSLIIRGTNELIFNSGNFIKDWYFAKKKYLNEFSNDDEFFSHSSSVDHFIMDGAKFDTAYLHMDNDIPLLKYFINGHGKEDWSVIDGWEFFVEEGTTLTWDELKKFCGDI